VEKERLRERLRGDREITRRAWVGAQEEATRRNRLGGRFGEISAFSSRQRGTAWTVRRSGPRVRTANDRLGTARET
jgi:hypothetical protein